jgi:ABC-type nitrate/sulfonate/bicarbonate transport system permease component
LRLLVLPSAMPNLFVALRISSANCFDTAAAWAACLVATIVSVAAFLASRRLERAARNRLEAQS